MTDAPPENPNTLSPEVEVSEGAELVSAPDLVGGEAATYELTAPNGDVVSWQVTINLRLGISFRLDGDLAILEAGFTDTSDPAAADDWGNGQPGGSVDSGSGLLTAVVLRTVYDFATESLEPPEYAWLEAASAALGTYVDFSFEYHLDDPVGDPFEMRFLKETGTLVITATGPVDSGIAGVFEADGTNSMDATPVSIADGFFKVRRIADDMFIMPN